MRRKSLGALDAALEALRRGSSLGECLAELPEPREDLEPLLLVAHRLLVGPHPVPRAAYRRALRERLSVAAASRLAPTAATGHPARLRALLRLIRPVAAGIALAAVAGGAVGVSASSVPSEMLYPARLAVERVQLAVTPGDAERVQLRLTFAERRLDELEAQARAGDYNRVMEIAQRYEEEVQAIVVAGRQSHTPVEALLRRHASKSIPTLERVRESAPPSTAAKLRRATEMLVQARGPQSPSASQDAGGPAASADGGVGEETSAPSRPSPAPTTTAVQSRAPAATSTPTPSEGDADLERWSPSARLGVRDEKDRWPTARETARHEAADEARKAVRPLARGPDQGDGRDEGRGRPRSESQPTTEPDAAAVLVPTRAATPTPRGKAPSASGGTAPSSAAPSSRPPEATEGNASGGRLQVLSEPRASEWASQPERTSVHLRQDKPTRRSPTPLR